MNSFGVKGLAPFGYLQVIKILNFFTNGLVKGAAKITYLVFRMQMVVGVHLRIKLHRLQKKYFHDLFTSENPTDMESVLDVVEKRFTREMNNSLLQPYTTEEVRQALFQMHPSKSPGPDSMSPFFFQKFWNIVGVDVTDAILSVLNSGHMLRKMNYSQFSYSAYSKKE